MKAEHKSEPAVAYGFKSPRRIRDYRPRSMAEVQARVLLERLDVSAEKVEELLAPESAKSRANPFRTLILRWGSELPENIIWYERRVRLNRWYQSVGVIAVLLAGVAALAWTASPKSFVAKLLTDGQSPTSASVGLVVAVVLTLLQVIALFTDKRARIGSFWKASAELQERLLTFEEHWLGRPILVRVDDTRDMVSPEFVAALMEEVEQARAIVHQERNTFFSTMISPSDLLSLVSQGVGAVRGQRHEVDRERERLDAVRFRSRAQQASELQAKLASAQADYEAKIDARDQLPAGTADPIKATANIAAEAARLDVERLRSRLAAVFSGRDG